MRTNRDTAFIDEQYAIFIKRPLAWPNAAEPPLDALEYPSTRVRDRIYDHTPELWTAMIGVSERLWRNGQIESGKRHAPDIALKAYRDKHGDEPGLEVEILDGDMRQRVLAGEPYRSLHDGAVYQVHIRLMRMDSFAPREDADR
jgi:hypothetical protein